MQVLPVGVAVSQDPESNVVTANLALSDLLGVSPGENIATRLDPESADSFEIYKEGCRLATLTILCLDPQEPGNNLEV